MTARRVPLVPRQRELIQGCLIGRVRIRDGKITLPNQPRLPDVPHHPWCLLASLGAIAGSFILFLKIWSEVADQDARAVDAAILRSLRVVGHPDVPIGPEWLRQAMLEIASLGGTTLLRLLIVGVFGYLLIRGARHRALWLAAATLAGSGAVSLLKNIFGRPRPELIDHLVATQTTSFPSGHAANAALDYLSIASLASDLERSRPARIYILAVAIAITLLIGVSRLYLGVHWPTDVVAGWAFGAGWAWAWRLAAGRFSWHNMATD